MVKFNWIDTFWPLHHSWWAPPLSIFLMRQYISSGVPDDLIDASSARWYRAFRHLLADRDSTDGAGPRGHRRDAVHLGLERLSLRVAGAQVGRYAHRHRGNHRAFAENAGGDG